MALNPATRAAFAFIEGGIMAFQMKVFVNGNHTVTETNPESIFGGFMINVTFCETVYPAPEDDEDDYCPEGESETRFDTVTFRELVRLMREYSTPSCSHGIGATYEWLNADPEQDYRTGEWIEKSLHFARINPARRAKYWRLAMKAAGVIK